MCVCARARVCMCVSAYVHASVLVHMCVCEPGVSEAPHQHPHPRSKSSHLHHLLLALHPNHSIVHESRGIWGANEQWNQGIFGAETPVLRVVLVGALVEQRLCQCLAHDLPQQDRLIVRTYIPVDRRTRRRNSTPRSVGVNISRYVCRLPHAHANLLKNIMYNKTRPPYLSQTCADPFQQTNTRTWSLSMVAACGLE